MASSIIGAVDIKAPQVEDVDVDLQLSNDGV